MKTILGRPFLQCLGRSISARAHLDGGIAHEAASIMTEIARTERLGSALAPKHRGSSISSLAKFQEEAKSAELAACLCSSPLKPGRSMNK